MATAYLIVLHDPYSNRPKTAPSAPVSPRTGHAIELEERNEIGRSSSSAITIRLLHPSVSKHHARIWFSKGRWMFLDLPSFSTNDLWVQLTDRDRVYIGGYTFLFTLQLPNRNWLTPNVRALACCVSANRDFHLLPILGDALEEAGCDDKDSLEHCRMSPPDRRISWVAEYICDHTIEGR